MKNDKNTSETPQSFLESLGSDLQKTSADTGLANILAAHILRAAPAQNAVAQAKEAIIKLAGERAGPPKPEAADV